MSILGPAPQQLAGASGHAPPPPQQLAGGPGTPPPPQQRQSKGQGPTPQGASVPAVPSGKRTCNLKHSTVEVEVKEQGREEEEEPLRVEEEEATHAVHASEEKESWSEKEGQSGGVREAIENIMAEQAFKGQSPERLPSPSKGPERLASAVQSSERLEWGPKAPRGGQGKA
ncbi:proline-, glutamic acid- and leucine-rich protein 1-like [Notolabrus celidotus]|uniref:proline-, glutamic acid- and leucine-rich protein 1-like n=1 Tax=Notolabrus celidotus TaxID=1203425 RepID=UPI00148FB08F|nr:proline-, glutamic acid- and leucine-rich protein 1-like [Notolabrus celidotus]